jgi:hypothetical protein
MPSLTWTILKGGTGMAYICPAVAIYEGKKVGNGQCVVFVQHCATAPSTTLWKKGEKVRGNMHIRKGTAVATFDSNERYPNHATGNHAAIYDGQDSFGIYVYDQWVARGVVGRRLIGFKGGVGSPSNDGDAFFVIQ